MNKFMMFLLRRKYQKKLRDAAKDIASGRKSYMCTALDKRTKKLPLYSQENFRKFITKYYPDLVQYLEEDTSIMLPWFNIEASMKARKSKEFRFLLAWAKSDYLEWIAYNI